MLKAKPAGKLMELIHGEPHVVLEDGRRMGLTDLQPWSRGRVFMNWFCFLLAISMPILILAWSWAANYSINA